MSLLPWSRQRPYGSRCIRFVFVLIPLLVLLLGHVRHASFLRSKESRRAQLPVAPMRASSKRAFVDGFVPWPKEEPLFLVYGHIERFWGDHVAKSFMWVVHNLTLSKGWQRILVSSTEHVTPDLHALGELILAHYGRPADVLLFLQDYDWLQPRAPNHTLWATSLLVWWDDTHRLPVPEIQGDRKIATTDVALSTYDYAIEWYVPLLTNMSRVWVPHSAMPSFILPFNHTPRTDAVLLVGYVHDPYVYPVRAHLYNLHKDGDKRIDLFTHPGWAPVQSDRQRQMAVAMSKYLATITDCSRLNYVLGKTFEIPATGTLLLMSDDIVEPLKLLGFIEGVNYKTYNLRNLDSVLAWVLHPDNGGEVDRIRLAGQQLIVQRHQTFHRAEMIHETALAVYRQGGRAGKARWVLPQPYPGLPQHLRTAKDV